MPQGISECLMTCCLPLAKGRLATFISAYALTMTNPNELKEKFYGDLDVLIKYIPTDDKIYLLGDFNARIGTDADSGQELFRTMAWVNATATAYCF